MKFFKKLRQKHKELGASVYIFDENGEKELKYEHELPENIKLFCFCKSNVIRIHKNLIARNIIIGFSKKSKNCKCFLDDSQGASGLDIDVRYLDGEFSELSIGKNTGMNGTKIVLGNGSKCYIGNNCRFSYEIVIRTSDGHTILDNDTNEIINQQKCDCIIGDNSWIGLRSIINKNVQLAHDTIVGSGSVVTKQFSEPYTIIAGNPAKVIKRNVRHDKRTIFEYTKQMQDV